MKTKTVTVKCDVCGKELDITKNLYDTKFIAAPGGVKIDNVPVNLLVTLRFLEIGDKSIDPTNLEKYNEDIDICPECRLKLLESLVEKLKNDQERTG